MMKWERIANDGSDGNDMYNLAKIEWSSHSMNICKASRLFTFYWIRIPCMYYYGLWSAVHVFNGVRYFFTYLRPTSSFEEAICNPATRKFRLIYHMRTFSPALFFSILKWGKYYQLESHFTTPLLRYNSIKVSWCNRCPVSYSNILKKKVLINLY